MSTAAPVVTVTAPAATAPAATAPAATAPAATAPKTTGPKAAKTKVTAPASAIAPTAPTAPAREPIVTTTFGLSQFTPFANQVKQNEKAAESFQVACENVSISLQQVLVIVNSENTTMRSSFDGITIGRISVDTLIAFFQKIISSAELAVSKAKEAVIEAAEIVRVEKEFIAYLQDALNNVELPSKRSELENKAKAIGKAVTTAQKTVQDVIKAISDVEKTANECKELLLITRNSLFLEPSEEQLLDVIIGNLNTILGAFVSSKMHVSFAVTQGNEVLSGIKSTESFAANVNNGNNGNNGNETKKFTYTATDVAYNAGAILGGVAGAAGAGAAVAALGGGVLVGGALGAAAAGVLVGATGAAGAYVGAEATNYPTRKLVELGEKISARRPTIRQVANIAGGVLASTPVIALAANAGIGIVNGEYYPTAAAIASAVAGGAQSAFSGAASYAPSVLQSAVGALSTNATTNTTQVVIGALGKNATTAAQTFVGTLGTNAAAIYNQTFAEAAKKTAEAAASNAFSLYDLPSSALNFVTRPAFANVFTAVFPMITAGAIAGGAAGLYRGAKGPAVLGAASKAFFQDTESHNAFRNARGFLESTETLGIATGKGLSNVSSAAYAAWKEANYGWKSVGNFVYDTAKEGLQGAGYGAWYAAKNGIGLGALGLLGKATGVLPFLQPAAMDFGTTGTALASMFPTVGEIAVGGLAVTAGGAVLGSMQDAYKGMMRGWDSNRGLSKPYGATLGLISGAVSGFFGGIATGANVVSALVGPNPYRELKTIGLAAIQLVTRPSTRGLLHGVIRKNTFLAPDHFRDPDYKSNYLKNDKKIGIMDPTATEFKKIFIAKVIGGKDIYAVKLSSGNANDRYHIDRYVSYLDAYANEELRYDKRIQLANIMLSTHISLWGDYIQVFGVDQAALILANMANTTPVGAIAIEGMYFLDVMYALDELLYHPRCMAFSIDFVREEDVRRFSLKETQERMMQIIAYDGIPLNVIGTIGGFLNRIGTGNPITLNELDSDFIGDGSAFRKSLIELQTTTKYYISEVQKGIIPFKPEEKMDWTLLAFFVDTNTQEHRTPYETENEVVSVTPVRYSGPDGWGSKNIRNRPVEPKPNASGGSGGGAGKGAGDAAADAAAPPGGAPPPPGAEPKKKKEKKNKKKDDSAAPAAAVLTVAAAPADAPAADPAAAPAADPAADPAAASSVEKEEESEDESDDESDDEDNQFAAAVAGSLTSHSSEAGAGSENRSPSSATGI